MSQNESASSKSINEELLFEGSPSWLGRFRAFAITWALALLLVIVPIIITVASSGFPWWITAICIVVAMALVVAQIAYHNTIRYRITTYRIDFERGLWTRRIDSLELWHAHDLFFRQTLPERLVGVGDIDVISDDESTPRLQLKAIPDARNTFEKLKSAILVVKKQRGILEIDK